MQEKTALLGKIAILSTDLVNRIAAGEVIERPASVVKELVENSIDAGSTRIEVDLKAGGRLLVRVQDDGEGMHKQDALLAFQRHATSKIRTDQDLLSIQTLGFRGEALPSIAAVSKVRMVTSPRGGEDPVSGFAGTGSGRGGIGGATAPHGPPQVKVGTEVLLEAGELLKVHETGAPPGTQIEVRELFFNTPARLKFLKSIATELGHVSRLMNQQALAHPHLSFRLSHEGKQLLDLPAVQSWVQRVEQVYGRSFADHLAMVEGEWAKIKIWGAVSKPPYTKGTRAYQEVFINGRPISSPFILHAVYEAYDAAIMKGQHPVVLLFLEMDGQMLDVNVHPTKREVRFHNQKLIYDLIKECVKTGFQRTFQEGIYSSDSPSQATHTDRVREAAVTYLKTHAGPEMEGRLRGADQNSGLLSEGPGRPSPVVPYPASRGGGSDLSGLLEEVRPLGQVYDTYILARIHGELWIIDQHAAHERVLYERYLKAIQESQIPVQRLLIPQTLELSKAQMMILKEGLDSLESLGLEMESFGPQSMVIRALPPFLAKADLESLVIDLIEDWIGMEKTPSAEDRQKGWVATMACHGAIKANDGLTVPEMEALLRDILQLPMAITCPHGRPLRVKFSRKELETIFHR